MAIALILAGGTGSTRDGWKPKQFLELAGRPVIVHTLENFERHPEISGIVVVCLEPWINHLKAVLESASTQKVKRVVGGGETVAESLTIGLEAISELVGDDADAIVLVHEAVRPFINAKTISENIRTVSEHSFSITVNRAAEKTMLVDETGTLHAFKEAQLLRFSQTPYGFFLRSVIEKLRTMRPEVSDPLFFLSDAGFEPREVLGPRENFRIFSSTDYFRAQGLINAKENPEISNSLKVVPHTERELYEMNVLVPEKMRLDVKRAPEVRRELEEKMAAPVFPLFWSIEIETFNRCNGECAFCPVNKHDDTRKPILMSEELFKSIIGQLAEIGYDGRVQLYSNNEPLLDARIGDFATYARKRLPSAFLSILTNGTLLTMEKFLRLLPLVDNFGIDNYYEEWRLPDNLRPIAEYCLRRPECMKKVMIQMVNRNAVRNNRGGMSKNRNIPVELQTPCKCPFIQVIVRPDGKISLCCNDALGKHTLGDLTRQRLIEIWHSDAFRNVRQSMLQGRASIPMCRYCDNFGGFGQNASKEWVFSAERVKRNWDVVADLLAQSE